MSEANFVYIVTHTENDYYGDYEKFMGCGATQEAAKQALLEYLGPPSLKMMKKEKKNFIWFFH